MIAAILLLAGLAHAGVVRAPVVLGHLSTPSAPAFSAPMAALPPFLSVANPVDAAMLSAVLKEAQASPTAVKVLAQVARAAEERGRPVVVEFVKMKEAGTFNIDWGVLSLNRRDMKASPRRNVATVIHELQHLLQTRVELPSDLLETELEAYVTDFRVSREMNDPAPRRGSYDARAKAAFKQGLEPFLAFLRREYPEDAQLHGTTAKAYAARLTKGLEDSTAKLERLRGERAERLRVLEQMKDLGHTESERENYRQDSVAPVDAAISTMERAAAWARHDLAVLASPELRAAARAYARAVVRRARAFQKVFARS